MDENLAYWSASFNERENGSLRPSPLLPMLLPTYLTGYPLTHLTIMTVQDVIPLSTFNPHGGPITHSSTGSKPDSPVYLWFRNILAFGFESCHEPPFERWSIPDALNPFLTLCSGINRLSIRLKLLIVPSYFTLDVFLKFNSRDTSVTFPAFFFTRQLTI